MKVDNIISVRLSEDEMKDAVRNYIINHLPCSYGDHIRKNEFIIDSVDGEYIICIDGVINTDTIQ